jgi:hypothetical protein
MLLARRALLLLLLPLLLISCSSAATAAQSVPSGPMPTSAGAGPSPLPAAATDPAPSPSTTAAATPIATPPPAPPAAPPDPLFVGFAGLAPGSYPVHLHRICSGLQGYHLAYLPDLAISAAGSGGIAVPAADFRNGWCLVVYANRAQTSVVAYRPI